jgi:hypothetical protein
LKEEINKEIKNMSVGGVDKNGNKNAHRPLLQSRE